jgi:hypothetical protein
LLWLMMNPLVFSLAMMIALSCISTESSDVAQH